MTPGGYVAVGSWGVVVGLVLYGLSHDVRRCLDDRASRRHVRQMGHATKVTVETPEEREIKRRVRADRLRELLDGAAEEAAMMEEARWWGWLADNPEIGEMYAAIVALPVYDRLGSWTEHE